MIHPLFVFNCLCMYSTCVQFFNIWMYMISNELSITIERKTLIHCIEIHFSLYIIFNESKFFSLWL